jgi:adenylate kinase
VVPDQIVFDLLIPVVAAAAVAGGYIPDGFPTTLPQAITAAELGVQLDLTLDAAVYLHVPEPVLVQRLLAWVRPDDTPEVIRHRLQVFTRHHQPADQLLPPDRGILVEVDADQLPESITAEI